ncbi:MAG: aspartyl protease family protein [Ekhidna sp.]|nr:aspartyl protease family protein [Ekhidna sp.]MBC6410067.1 aspartyl protease family protein [Ekhidna sp.]MBC6427010.1 aspartyl protease family protein [Ekhidna sp.]
MKKPVLLFAISLFVTSSFAQKPITFIPFELFGDHIIIKVSIDDSEPLDFIFDTGAGLTVLDEDIIKKLGLSGQKIEIEDSDMDWQLIKHNKMEINNFLMERNIKVYSTDFDHLEISLGMDIDGIVGNDLLKHHAIYTDFDRMQIDIYKLGQGPKNGDAIPFTFDTSIPVVKGNVVLNNGEPHDGTFYFMTGAGTTLDFNAPYAEEWDIIHKTGKHYSYLAKGLSKVETPHYEGHVISFSFGNQTIEDLPIGISTATGGIQASKNVSGIIGSQIIRMYNFTIDYKAKMIYLVKDEVYDANFNTNCSGFDVQLAKDKETVLIHEVFENSPASEAGIKINDELLKINGRTMAEVNLPNIKKLLKQEGEKVDLMIKQDGEEKLVTLELRSLID